MPNKIDKKILKNFFWLAALSNNNNKVFAFFNNKKIFKFTVTVRANPNKLQ